MMRLFTHSSSKAFRACNYMYWCMYVAGHRPVKSGNALVFGTLIHKCLEAYWLARKAGIAAPASRALAELAAERDIDPYERVRAKLMLITYALIWDTVKCTVVDVECEFQHPLLDPKTMAASRVYRRAGKIDLVIQMHDVPEGNHTIVEHKTSAEEIGVGSDYRARLTLDEQVSFYYAGAKALGYKPNEVIYDVLKKFREQPHMATPEDKREYVVDKKTKQRRLRANQRDRDETPEEYGRRLSEMVAKDPEKYIVRISVHRMQRERLKSALNVWQQSKLMEFALENECFPKNSDSCFKNRCSFITHCYHGTPLTDEKVFRKSEVMHPELDKEQGQEEESVDTPETPVVGGSQ